MIATSSPIDTAAALPLTLTFLLVLCRVSVAVMLLPGIGEADPPPVLRAGLACALTILIAPIARGTPPMPAAGFAALLAAILHEITCGFFLGGFARLAAVALPVAGQIMSLATGLTSVIQPDPALGAQSSALTRLLSLSAPVLVLSSGLYALPIEALANSYHALPLGAPLDLRDATETVTCLTASTFACAFRFACPFVLAGVLWQVCLGLLARFVPTVQAGVALVPGQLLGGCFLLAAFGQHVLSAWIEQLERSFAMLAGIFHG